MASISSPVPVAWYPTLAVAMVAVGLMLTASSFMSIQRTLRTAQPSSASGRTAASHACLDTSPVSSSRPLAALPSPWPRSLADLLKNARRTSVIRTASPESVECGHVAAGDSSYLKFCFGSTLELQKAIQRCYDATSSRRSRSLAKEITTAAVASVFLGFGSLFVLLASGVYV